MKTWKRIAACCLSVSTMGITLMSSACGVEASSTNSASTLESASETIHIHEWKEQIILPATCTERGAMVKKCGCGEEEYIVLGASHNLVKSREAETTCTQMGIIRVHCENCEYETYETEDPKGHMFLFGSDCLWCGQSKEEIESPNGGNNGDDGNSGNNGNDQPGMDDVGTGWWAQLKQNSVGGGLNTDYSGDIVIDGNPTAAVPYDGSPVTIKFYHTLGQKLREVLDAALPAFTAMYPNITVEHESQGDYPSLRDQIVTEIQANDSPNLAYCYPDHVALYNKSRVVVTLDDYIASETMGFTQAEVNQFVRAYYEEGRSYGDGKMYTLPYSKSTEVLYYNKTFFDANNLTVPTTWDEMEALVQKISQIDENCVPLGYDSEGNWFITMCEQLGTPYTSLVEGEKFLFDVSTNQEFVGRFREWYKWRYVTTEETYGSYTSDLFTETDPNKLKSYMTIGSSAGASYQCPDPYTDENGQVVYPFEVGVAMPPQLDPENPKTIFQGPSLCMFKKTDPQEMAATWLFMKFLTTNPALQAAFSEASGYAPVIKNLDKTLPAYANFLATANGNANLQATCVKQCLAQEDAMFVSPAFLGSSAARDSVSILIQNCFINDPAEGQSVADFIKNEFSAIIADLRSTYGA